MSTGRPSFQEISTSADPSIPPPSTLNRPLQVVLLGGTTVQEYRAVVGMRLFSFLSTATYLKTRDFPANTPVMSVNALKRELGGGKCAGKAPTYLVGISAAASAIEAVRIPPIINVAVRNVVSQCAIA